MKTYFTFLRFGMAFFISLLFVIITGITMPSEIKSKEIKATILTSQPRSGSYFSIYIQTDIQDPLIPSQLYDSGFLLLKNQPGIYYRSFILKDTGWYTYGPFSFIINNVHYSTNSIKINVIENLKRKIGRWARCF